MIGSGEKIPTETELKDKTKVRRSIVAKRDLPAGHKISIDDLDWVRPGTGLRPGEEQKVIGIKLNRNIRAGKNIKLRS